MCVCVVQTTSVCANGCRLPNINNRWQDPKTIKRCTTYHLCRLPRGSAAGWRVWMLDSVKSSAVAMRLLNIHTCIHTYIAISTTRTHDWWDWVKVADGTRALPSTHHLFIISYSFVSARLYPIHSCLLLQGKEKCMNYYITGLIWRNAQRWWNYVLNRDLEVVNIIGYKCCSLGNVLA